MAPKKHYTTNNKSNNKIDKKVAAALARRPVPPPPSRRPNIQERISMLQMAQLYHRNDYIPSSEGAYRLVLPEVPMARAGSRMSSTAATATALSSPAHNNKRKARNGRGGFRFWRKRQN